MNSAFDVNEQRPFEMCNNILKDSFIKFLPLKYNRGAFRMFCQYDCSEGTNYQAIFAPFVYLCAALMRNWSTVNRVARF